MSSHLVDRQVDASLVAVRASPIVLCVRMSDPEIAMEAACAAVRGGIRCIEIAMTTPDAPALISALSARCPGAHVGAGTVLTVADADTAAACGARFALSPAVDAEVIARLHAHGVLAVPGAATPTEVATAGVRCGARLVKLFPVELIGGVRLVRALQGPLGQVPLLPTSGIQLAGADAYFAERNVAAVGASRQVLEPAAVARRDWDAVAENAHRWVEVAAKRREWRREKCDGSNRKVSDGG